MPRTNASTPQTNFAAEDMNSATIHKRMEWQLCRAPFPRQWHHHQDPQGHLHLTRPVDVGPRTNRQHTTAFWRRSLPQAAVKTAESQKGNFCPRRVPEELIHEYARRILAT